MIMHNRFHQHLAKFIAVLYYIIQGHVLCDGGINGQCINSEAVALLRFKGGLKDPSNRLSSWTLEKDCCQWNGVECNTTTGHVISLNLHCANNLDALQGDLNPSLVELPYLSSLKLSGNNFMQSKVPAFLGAMKNLKHLDLSNANFKGNLPEVILGNLSQLESLDLSGKGNSLEVNNLTWLGGISSLKNLDLSDVALGSNANDWLLYISLLPSLVTLHLSCCQLRNLPSSPPKMNFDSLITLDLSINYFNTTIPDWLFESCHHLQHLDLSNTQLQGPIPDSIGRLTSLVTLDLSGNELIGPIPSTFGQAHGQNRAQTSSCLKELYLSHNQLNGSLERRLGQLSELVVLDIAQNNLVGNITDPHLANFNNLRVLNLSSNHLTFHVSKNWVPPFQLKTIGLVNCELGPQFPKWIQTQKNLSRIDISNAGILDIVPDWFWDLSPTIEYMNLSHNELRGCTHDFSQTLKLDTLDLSNNRFSCPLPHLPPNMKILKLTMNSFYGNISHVCEMLGVNNSLSYLDLSSNNFSGNIPNCWKYGQNMGILDLGNNSFSGSVPDSLGSLTNLHILSMRENDLSGKFPDSLKDCRVLTLLDLGTNQFFGPIPYWISEETPILKILFLRGNSFEGNIPTTLCLLKSLKILDLSDNHLTGEIPRCVFAAMATNESINDYSYMEYQTIKGILSMYQQQSRVRELSFIALDLSSNFLTGEIPVEFTNLVELRLLNLSRNQLVGSIPSDIGELVNMEFLDLSRNQLSCAIPTSMANIDRLTMLDLSHNHLSGKIPIGTQLQSFNMSCFEGNAHLCGLPLPEACPTNISYEDMHCSDNQENRESDGNHEDNGVILGMSSFDISAAIGFFTGFWLFWGSLILITSWRHAYFRFLANVSDWVYVTIAVALSKLRRKFHSQLVPR